jgi:hypothetical protein
MHCPKADCMNESYEHFEMVKDDDCRAECHENYLKSVDVTP